MPANLVRKLSVVAAVDGLILQAYGSSESPFIRIDYKTNKITSGLLPASAVSGRIERENVVELEAFGIAGKPYNRNFVAKTAVDGLLKCATLPHIY